MDETRARALLGMAAGAEAPPSRVNVDLARRQGRKKLRWRRTGQAGAPALAAIAVTAVTMLASSAPGGAGQLPGSTPHQHTVTGGQVAAPRRFNPLIPYAAFGWLPTGETTDGGQLAPTTLYLTADHAHWSLTAMVTGRCNLTSQQVLRQLRHGKRPMLNCKQSSSGGLMVPITKTAPPVAGHLAFWTLGRGYLVWEYARGSWAFLSTPRTATASQISKVADNIRYRVATSPSLRFPVQLTGLPAKWRVAATYFKSAGGVLRTSQYSLAGARSYGYSFTTDPATANSGCYFYPDGQSKRARINGDKVVINSFKPQDGRPAEQQLCAAHADGLFVFISAFGSHVSPSVVAVFAHHLKLLGTDPARWTTRPLS